MVMAFGRGEDEGGADKAVLLSVLGEEGTKRDCE